MDVREKLVELLNEVQETGVNEIPAGFGCTREYVKNEKVASHLVAHGVTVQDNTEITDELVKQLRNAPLTVLHEEPTIEVVQEWISVKDRLPEMRDDGFADAFLVTDGSLAHIAYFVDGEWIFTDNGQMKEPMFYDVTHWQYLPQPPKGE